ncbi:MAG: hypothetical protein M3310_06745, partial [Actinomycetota bacterium]|nr:hypothetical protein [Actinomycetota bacterium]
LWPAVLAPLAFAHVWKLRGRRDALVAAATFAGVVGAVFLPFALVAPAGLWDALWRQAERPLQIESLGAGLLLAAHHAFGLELTMESSHGSQNLAGVAPDALAVASTLAQVGVLTLIWGRYARGRASAERLLCASAAAVCAFIAFGKVLSPQFLIWLVPLVPLVAGRRGLVASALLAAALVLTQLWFPFRYWELALEFDAVASWLVLVRDLALVALVAVLTPRARAGPARR